VFLQLRREAFPSFLQLFFSASLEAMDYPQPLPEARTTRPASLCRARACRDVLCACGD
jgi:hypothetical protein